MLDPRFGGLAAGVLDEARRGVGAEREALRADELRQPLGRLAEPAADVDAAPALGRRKAFEDLLGDLVQRADEHLAILLPPLVENGVPGAHRLLVGERHRARGLIERHWPTVHVDTGWGERPSVAG